MISIRQSYDLYHFKYSAKLFFAVFFQSHFKKRDLSLMTKTLHAR